MAEKIPKIDLKQSIQNGLKVPGKTFAEEDRKRGGRPKLPPEEKKSRNKITVYVLDSEKIEIDEAAAKLGLNAQAFMRMAALQYIRGE